MLHKTHQDANIALTAFYINDKLFLESSTLHTYDCRTNYDYFQFTQDIIIPTHERCRTLLVFSASQADLAVITPTLQAAMHTPLLTCRLEPAEGPPLPLIVGRLTEWCYAPDPGDPTHTALRMSLCLTHERMVQQEPPPETL